MYILKRTDGQYVTRPGQAKSYTLDIRQAQLFTTREQADAARCQGNEIIATLSNELGIV